MWAKRVENGCAAHQYMCSLLKVPGVCAVLASCGLYSHENSYMHTHTHTQTHTHTHRGVAVLALLGARAPTALLGPAPSASATSTLGDGSTWLDPQRSAGLLAIVF